MSVEAEGERTLPSGENDGRIRVLVADDHPLISMALRTLIDASDDLRLVAQAIDGQQAVEMFEQRRPDVTVLDLRMPKLDGLDVIEAIVEREAAARILVYTAYGSPDDIYRCLRAGAQGYVLKNAPAALVLEAIRRVSLGDRFLSSEVAERLADRAAVPDLTSREIEVLVRMSEGLSNAQIAEELFITLGTVKFHVVNILRKLRAKDRLHAVSLAYRRGFLRP